MGKLYFHYSTMNAGKSTALLQANHNYIERGMKTHLLTAKLDDRAGVSTGVDTTVLAPSVLCVPNAQGSVPRRHALYVRSTRTSLGRAVRAAFIVAPPGAVGQIHSRIGITQPAEVFDSDTDLLALLAALSAREEIACVFVDEAQFLSKQQVGLALGLGAAPLQAAGVARRAALRTPCTHLARACVHPICPMHAQGPSKACAARAGLRRPQVWQLTLTRCGSSRARWTTSSCP